MEIAVNNFSEFKKVVENMPVAIPADMETFNKAVKGSADFGERMTKVAIEAAEKNVEISTDWTRETLTRLRTVAQVQENPADYTRAFNEFASDSANAASEHFSAIAEVAKNMNKHALEIFLAAGKEAREEATASVENMSIEPAKTARKETKAK